MVIKMKSKKINIIYGAIFLFFVFLFFLSPISGDDWGNYLVGKTGIYHSFGNALGMYFSWEGRIISRVFINLLTYHKVIWNFLNSFIIVGIIYYIGKIIRPKNKIYVLLSSLFLFLFMNLYTFSQVIVWLAGNITYLFVILLLLFYFYWMFEKKDFSWKQIILLSFLNFISTMFVEHMAILLILSNLFFLSLSFYQNKKIDRRILLFLICSIVGTLLMFLSPGTRLRNGMENIEFNQLSFFGKIFYNLPNFIFFTYISNYSLFLLMIPTGILLSKNIIRNKVLRILHYLFLLFPILTSISSIFSFLSISILGEFSNPNSIFNTVYYILYSIDFVILFFFYTKEKKNIKAIFFLLLGFFSNGIMMLSPTWGYRTGFATYLFMGVSFIMVLDSYLSNKKFYNYFFFSLNSFMMIFFLVLYFSVHCQYLDNYKRIQEGIKNHSKQIEIVEYPSFVNCNINPTNEYHLMKFKEYYGIQEDVQIILLKNSWKWKILYKEK